MTPLRYPTDRERTARRAVCCARWLLLAALPTTALPACDREEKPYDKSVIVLGFDGMDPVLTKRMMDEGRLPNFVRLRDQGGFSPLGTATPPQSPVAWANFTTGLNPGGHGLFDFIARDPNPPDANRDIDVFSAMSTTVPEESWLASVFSLVCGDSIDSLWDDYEIPLTSSRHELLRFGTPFWEYLSREGIPAWVYRLPANFPGLMPSGKNFHALTDMGTPDLAGGHGEFAYYTDGPFDFKQNIAGGTAYSVRVADGMVLPKKALASAMLRTVESPTRIVLRARLKKRLDNYAGAVAVFRRPDDKGHCVRPIAEVDIQARRIELESPCDFKLTEASFVRIYSRCKLRGPENGVLKKKREHGRAIRAVADFAVWLDPEDPVACIEVGDRKVLLREGEWSGWCPVEFPMAYGWFIETLLPPAEGICRFYLKQVRPRFELYVSPVNYDPLDPVIPLCVPQGFSAEVAKVIGRHYTQGLPEEYAALKESVLTRDEFLHQADLVATERMKLLDYALEHFHGGFLFLYYGGTDLVAHMFWAARDPDHPGITPEERDRYAHTVEEYYVVADQMLGRTMDRFPDALILALSDHGFETFARGFNLNTWLRDEGYLEALVPDNYSLPLNVNFKTSRAYGLGINGLYVNLQGREKSGIVAPADKQALLDEISAKLLEVVDPKTGKKVVKAVYQADRIYKGPYTEKSPDLQVGYARGYRGGWGTVLGGLAETTVEDNTDAWGADHCIATDLVPGILVSNRPITMQGPDLTDLAPTILKAFGVSPPEEMEGQDVFR